MALDRTDMIAVLNGRGWTHDMAFGQKGPVLFIRGDFRGCIEVQVPVDVSADHQNALNCVYALYGATMELEGKVGRA